MTLIIPNFSCCKLLQTIKKQRLLFSPFTLRHFISAHSYRYLLTGGNNRGSTTNQHILHCTKQQRSYSITRNSMQKQSEQQQPQPDFRHDEIHIRLAPSSGIQEEEHVESYDTMMMAFYLLGDYHDMKRSRKEEMVKSLQRLARNCATKYEKQNKTKRKKQSPTSDDATVSPVTPNTPIEEVVKSTYMTYPNSSDRVDATVLTNEDYQTGMKIIIPLHTSLILEYTIVVNPPSIVSLSTYPKTSYTISCPIVASVITEHASDYECLWYVQSTSDPNQYEYVSNHKLFIPTNEHIGKKLKLFCTGIRYHDEVNLQARTDIDLTLTSEVLKGRSFPFYLAGTVQAIPRSDQLLSRLNAVRQEYHEIGAANNRDYDVRVLSYNILSEGYAQRNHSINYLYKYCQPQYLETEYRIQRIAIELIASHADILLLQECDEKVFNEYLLPLLGSTLLSSSYSYIGHQTNKFSSVREGCATFINHTRFQVIQSIDLPIKEVLRHANYLQPFYSIRPDLRVVMGERLGTIAQITIVQDQHQPDQILVIANTHLFYHPLASYIRLLQMHTIVQRLEKIVNTIQSKGIMTDFSEEDDQAISAEVILKEQMEEHSLMTEQEKIDAYEKENTKEIEEEIKQRLQRLSVDEQSKKSTTGYTVSVVIGGDLNTTPGIVALDYLEIKNDESIDLNKLRNAWHRLTFFQWGDTAAETADESEEIEKILDQEEKNEKLNEIASISKKIDDKPLEDLHSLEKEKESGIGPLSPDLFTHSFELENTTKSIVYTNYTSGFQEPLDYLFTSKETLEVVRIAPMPTLEELQEEVATPSSIFPSDHLSIAIDLKYRKK